MRAAGVDPDNTWSRLPPPPPFAGGAGGGGEGAESERKEAWVEGVDVDDAGRPTGLFREDSMRLLEAAVTKPSFETRYV